MTSSSSAASARVAKLQIDPTGTRERFFRGLLFKIHREKKNLESGAEFAKLFVRKNSLSVHGRPR